MKMINFKYNLNDLVITKNEIEGEVQLLIHSKNGNEYELKVYERTAVDRMTISSITVKEEDLQLKV